MCSAQCEKTEPTANFEIYIFSMKRKYFLYAFALTVLPLQAQDIYKVEQFAGEDLNGTARFVGMGGAMNALGADLSAIGTNPASIGLFRRNDVSLSGSVTTQPNALSLYNIDKSRASFDQLGFVYSTRIGGSSIKYLNFGFNYQKRRNFKSFIGLDGVDLGGLSQSMEMANLGSIYGKAKGDLAKRQTYVSPIAEVGYLGYLIDPDASGNLKPVNATKAYYQRAQHGGIQQYDFNVSMNYKDRIFAGLTFGFYNVNMNSYTLYSEDILDPGGSGQTQPYKMSNEQALTGNGFDVKAGVIFRPVENDPFRIGFSVSTPIWFSLTGNNLLLTHSPFTKPTEKDPGYATDDFDYNIRTPWKFNISLGTTVGNFLALDAEYEYKDYSGSSISYPDYNSLDPWTGISNNYQDKALKGEINRYLKGVSTFRLGAEARFAPGWFARLGYNYVSSPFSKDAFLNLFPNAGTSYGDSESILYQTGTDYVNLGDINRFTCGLGWHGKSFYVDLAYQYQAQKGDLYFFQVPVNSTEYRTNALKPQKIDLNRHNVLLTFGFKF